MRIYGKFELLNPYYSRYKLLEISTKPFVGGVCMCLDTEEGKHYNCEDGGFKDWIVYNGAVPMGNYLYNPVTKEYIDSRIVTEYVGPSKYCVELEDGRCFIMDDDSDEYPTYAGGYRSNFVKHQRFEDGEPIGEPRFEHP